MVPVIYMGRNEMILMRPEGNIHFGDHWKAWTLKNETIFSILGPEMVTSEASAIWAQ